MRNTAIFACLLLLLSLPTYAATANVQSQVGDTSFQAVGSGTTSGASTAILVHVGLTANERAAKFHGVVVSSVGVRKEVNALGYMIPDTGWVIFSQSGDAQITVNSPVAADLTITGTSGSVNWIGYVEISFTQSYAP